MSEKTKEEAKNQDAIAWRYYEVKRERDTVMTHMVKLVKCADFPLKPKA